MTDLQPLTQYVIDSAHQEVATKAKKSVPALKMGAVAGTFGVLAAAASYRLSVLLLEKVMPSEAAALTATVAYGSGAGCAAVVALRRLREAPVPLPIDTARRVADAVADREP
jgi:hypothetical protein